MVWLPVAMSWCHAQYELVCIDEAQDMNLPQLIMARKACHEGGRVIVVGDDRQAIYGFRGAAQDGMNLMVRELNAVELSLTITYRCPKAVVALAAQIVPDYRAADSAPNGTIAYMGAGKLVNSVEVGDAILSRANAPLMPICLALLRGGVPARIEGREIGKQLLGIVRSLRAKSVPNFLFKLNAWGQKQKNRIGKSENSEARIGVIEDQVAVLVAVAEGVRSVSEIEARINELFQDSNGFAKPAVVLSSVHKAKGLEWNRVHLLSKTFKPGAEGEEANIYYVALTRAKKELVFVSDEAPEGDRE
jgi:superfamily I DNA/RNA helicase